MEKTRTFQRTDYYLGTRMTAGTEYAQTDKLQ
jgi:hypothetical protein